MKKLFLIVASLLLSTTLMSQSIGIIHESNFKNTIDQLGNIEGFTIVRISKPMFQFIGKLDIDYPIQKLVDKIENFTLVTADAKTVNKNSRPIAIVDLNISKLNYEELITITDKGTTVRMVAKKSEDAIIKSFIMTVKSDKEFTLMVLNGNFIVEDFNDFMSMVK